MSHWVSCHAPPISFDFECEGEYLEAPTTPLAAVLTSMTPEWFARILPGPWNSVPPNRPEPFTGRMTLASTFGPDGYQPITRPPGRFSMSTMYGLSASLTSNIITSPEDGRPFSARGTVLPSFFRTFTGVPTGGAHPPKNPVPAGTSRVRNAFAPAAGATVWSGKMLMVLPASFSTDSVRCTAFTAEAATVPGAAHFEAVYPGQQCCGGKIPDRTEGKFPSVWQGPPVPLHRRSPGHISVKTGSAAAAEPKKKCGRCGAQPTSEKRIS